MDVSAAARNLATWADDRLNPLLVKDLRQACRGRFFQGAVLIFLFLQLLVLFAAMDGEIRRSSMQAGWEVFHAMLQILVVTTMGIMPLVIAWRLNQDFAPGEQDLFLITGLTPRQIIHGKVVSPMVMTAMFYALHSPLATLAVFLRGIDFPTIFVILGGGFLFTGLIYLLVVLAAVGPSRQNSAAGMLLVGGWFLYMGNMAFQGFIQSVRRRGFTGWGEMLAQYWEPLLIIILLGGVAYEMAIAQVSPPAANRSGGARRFLTWFFGLTFILTAVLTSVGGSPQPFEFWAGLLTVVAVFALPMSAADRLEPGRRVLAETPAGPLGRLRGFLFSSGAAGGMAWASLLTLFLIVGFKGGGLALGRSVAGIGNAESEVGAFTTILYTFNLAMTGLLLRRWSIAMGLADEYGAHFPLGLFLLTGIFPFLGAAVLGLSTRETPAFLYFSPFLAWERRHQFAVLGTQAGWALLSGLANLPWLSEQWAKFIPLPPPAPFRVARGKGGTADG
ncbi:MAG: hypothetical protein GX442_08170 [Candidatus Riflebacteria bacterium]|nr:hypothetical protein [Candidatus Riflebacteria bacterium]